MSLSSRPAEPSDYPYISESYAESYRMSHWAGAIPMPLWDGVARESLAWLLRTHQPTVTVAHGPEGDLYGWIAVQRGLMLTQRVRDAGRWVTRRMPMPPVVHYLYVGEPYRRMGIGKFLLAAAGVDIRGEFVTTHKTKMSSRLLSGRAGWRHNPLLARFEPRKAEEATREAL